MLVDFAIVILSLQRCASTATRTERQVLLSFVCRFHLQGRMAHLEAAGELSSRGAQLLRLLLEADALQDTAAALSGLLSMVSRAPRALSGASQAAAVPELQGGGAPGQGVSGTQLLCCARCSPQATLQETPSGSASGLRGHAARGRPITQTPPCPGSAASAPSQVCCSGALSTGSCSALLGGGGAPRWHVASEAASRQGFMAPAHAAGLVALGCAVAPAAMGLAVATRSVQQELETGALTHEARHMSSNLFPADIMIIYLCSCVAVPQTPTDA